MSSTEKLDRSEIHQGDTRYFTATLTVDPADLSSVHALHPGGFQTAAFTTRLYGRLDAATNKAESEIVLTATPESATTAGFILETSDTAAIAFPDGVTELAVHYEIEIADATQKYTLETGQFKLIKD